MSVLHTGTGLVNLRFGIVGATPKPTFCGGGGCG